MIYFYCYCNVSYGQYWDKDSSCGGRLDGAHIFPFLGFYRASHDTGTTSLAGMKKLNSTVLFNKDLI